MSNTKPIVIKFGGTSVSTAKNIQTIVDVVRRFKNKNPVVVVSALTGVTDLLLDVAHGPAKKSKKKIEEIRAKHQRLIQELWQDEKLANEIIAYVHKQLESIISMLNLNKPDKRLFDRVVSHGEIMSSYIISKWLEYRGIQSQQIIATNIIVTDNNFGSAEFLEEPTKKQAKKTLLPLINKGIIPVVTGFIGATQKGKVTTLGRGGSDYSASIIGLALNASEVQIWTDVDGIFTADPRLVSTARSIPNVSYQEASEMAFFGAKVLHPKTIRPAIKAGIPVKVLNTFNPTHKGTITYKKDTASRITAISFKKKVTLITIKAEEMFLAKGFLTMIFDLFSKQNISVDLVSVSEVTISLTLDRTEHLEKVISRIQKFARVVVDDTVSVVSIIGEHIGNKQHAIRDIFTILDEKKIRVKMISFSAQNRNISCVIDSSRCEEAVQLLHDGLLLGRKK